MSSQKALNGWLRLWIVVSIPWVAFWSIGFSESMPRERIAPHDDSFYAQLSESARRTLVLPDKAGAIPPGSPVEAEVAMPNGHVLFLREGAAEREYESMAEEYCEIAKNAAWTHWRIHVLPVHLYYVASFPVVLLAFGYGVSWIREGFRK